MRETTPTTSATGFAAVGELFGAHLEDEAKERLEADYQRLVITFGTAVLYGQLFEFFARMAAPALTAPVDDDAAARAAVADGLDRGLSVALQALRPAVEGVVAVPEGLHDRLDDARERRNALAHGFALPFVLAVLTGDIEGLIETLDADTAAFQGVVSELSEIAFGHALGTRAIDSELFEDAIVGLMLTATDHPDLLNGVERLQDFDKVLDRLRSQLEGEKVNNGEAAKS
jgi:hypothetical protein